MTRPAPVRVDDADDPRVALFAQVQRPAALRERGLFVAESRHAVRALLATPRFTVQTIWVTEEGWRDLEAAVLASTSQPEVLVSSKSLFAEVTGFAIHRGCLGLASRPAEVPLGALPRDARLVVALEQLADPDNLGSIFRNAAAFGADAVVLAPGGADPLYRKTVRVSTGAALRVPFYRAGEWPDDLDAIRERGFTVLAAVTEPGAIDVRSFGVSRPVPERVCLLFGNEDDGLSAPARAKADVRVTIPMARDFDSLNVAMASGILLHRFSREGGRL